MSYGECLAVIGEERRSMAEIFALLNRMRIPLREQGLLLRMARKRMASKEFLRLLTALAAAGR